MALAMTNSTKEVTIGPSAPNTHSHKACLFNLIIYTQDFHRIPYFQEIIQSIIDKFPCKIIFIKGNSDPFQDYLHTEMTRATIRIGDQEIICDQFIIDVSHKNLTKVPFFILPQLIPDLPIYLLWGQDPTQEHEILPHLHRFADRVIFDSEATESLQDFSKKMIEQVKKMKGEIVDMNWVRLGGWRNVLLQTFDTKDRINWLANSRQIKIVYNVIDNPSIQHQETQSIYLQAWLATQLKWKFSSLEAHEKNTRIIYKNKRGEITIDLIIQTEPSLSPGDLLSIEVVCENNHSFNMVRKRNCHK